VSNRARSAHMGGIYTGCRVKNYIFIEKV